MSRIYSQERDHFTGSGFKTRLCGSSVTFSQRKQSVIALRIQFYKQKYKFAFHCTYCHEVFFELIPISQCLFLFNGLECPTTNELNEQHNR